jgi:hypothetical protein
LLSVAEDRRARALGKGFGLGVESRSYQLAAGLAGRFSRRFLGCIDPGT